MTREKTWINQSWTFTLVWQDAAFWSFLGLLMTTYTAWYIAVASIVHGQVEGVKHSGPTTIMLYFTGATNILYTFGGHAVTV